MRDAENEHKSIVRRFGEALNSRDLNLLDELVAPDFARHCQATPGIEIRSLDEFKRFLQEDWTGVPDGKTAARLLVAEGDFVRLQPAYDRD